MKPGDLLKITRTTRAGIRSAKFKIIGVLLEEPILPNYGNFPKKYKVISSEGIVEIISDKHRFIIEVVK